MITPFKSDFTTSEARTWVGPEYWTNPMQDWQVENGELVCLVSKANRNVHVLTRKTGYCSGKLENERRFKTIECRKSIWKATIG